MNYIQIFKGELKISFQYIYIYIGVFMKRIKLETNENHSLFVDFYTLVDDDFVLGKDESLYGVIGSNHIYAQVKSFDPITKKFCFIPLHRYVLKLQKYELGFDVDHINGNSLDNRKENLRILSRSEHIKLQKRFSKVFRKMNSIFLPKVENLTIYNIPIENR